MRGNPAISFKYRKKG